MKKSVFFKVISISIFIVIFNSYINNNTVFHLFLDRWIGILIPIIWAVFLAILMKPGIEFFERKFKLKRVYSITIVLFIFILSITLILLSIVPQLINSIKEIISKSEYIRERVNYLSSKIINFLYNRGITTLDLNDIFQKIGKIATDNIGSMKIIFVSIFKNVVWWIVGITNFLLGLFLAVLLLLEKKTIETRDDIIFLMFGEKAEYIKRKAHEANTIFINYLIGKGIVSLIMFILVSLFLMITNTPYPLVIGLMIGIGNMIPYIGSIFFGIISIFLVLIMEPSKVIYLIIAMILVQTIDGYILGPKIIGDKVGLNSFWVMVSMIIFGGLFGIIGMFLAVPIMRIIISFYNDYLEYKKKKIIKNKEDN